MILNCIGSIRRWVWILVPSCCVATFSWSVIVRGSACVLGSRIVKDAAPGVPQRGQWWGNVFSPSQRSHTAQVPKKPPAFEDSDPHVWESPHLHLQGQERHSRHLGSWQNTPCPHPLDIKIFKFYLEDRKWVIFFLSFLFLSWFYSWQKVIFCLFFGAKRDFFLITIPFRFFRTSSYWLSY